VAGRAIGIRCGLAGALALAGAGACACSSSPDRPRTYQPPLRDAGPESDASTELPPEDPGPPLPVADLVFVLPHGGPAQTADLEFTVGVGSLDVHFSVDTTGSFQGEIDELQDSLLGVVLPGLRRRVPDATLGVSRFEDFPIAPFGDIDDRPFRLLQGQTTDDDRAARGVSLLEPLGNGVDSPESSIEALYQVATGEGLSLSGAEIVAPFERGDAAGTLGGVGFRAGALPVVVQVTDAPPHEESDYAPPIRAHSLGEVETALVELGARVVGIASGSAARPYLERMARATGSVSPSDHGSCATGIDGADRDADGEGLCPLVFDIEPTGEGLSSTIVDAVEALLETIVFDVVSVVVLDDELGFVTSALAVEAEPPDGTAPPGMADLEPPGGDGDLDSFTAVRSGTRLRFRLVLANDVLRSADYEQIFYLRARIVGDGETILDERTIQVIVPAADPAAPPDAGPDASAADAGPRDASIDG